MSRSFLSDNPTAHDLLGYQQLAERVAEHILKIPVDETPLTIGVYGAWGSGKTSFLAMVSACLERQRVTPVRFNAWKYDKEENLWAALLQTILDRAPVAGGVARRVWVKARIWWSTLALGQGSWANIKAAAPTLLRLTLALLVLGVAFGWNGAGAAAETNLRQFAPSVPSWLLRFVLGVLAFAAASPPTMWNLVNASLGLDFEKLRKKHAFRERIAFLDQFGDEFRRIVALISQGKPLVVVIDDLDRCLPERALSVLEAVKQFLDVPGCVFLIALDHEMVERAVAAKYDRSTAAASGEERPILLSPAESRFGANYIEKIVQLPIVLPDLTAERIETFIRGMQLENDVAACLTIFSLGVSPNPRRIKRLLRIFAFMRAIADQESGGRIRSARLATLIVIQHEFPAVYAELRSRPELWRALQRAARPALQTDTSQAPDETPLDPVVLEVARGFLARSPRLGRMLAVDCGDDVSAEGDLDAYWYVMTTVDKSDIVSAEVQRKESAEAVWSEHARRVVDTLSPLRLPAEGESAVPIFIPTRFFRGGAGTAGSEAATVSMKALLRTATRAWIVGGPGTGKTTFLRHLALIFGTTWRDTDGDRLYEELGIDGLQIPIFVSVREEMFSAGIRPLDMLAMALERSSHDRPRESLTALLETGRLVLFFDGIDGLPARSQTAAMEQIDWLAVNFPACRMLVTSRPLSSQVAGPFMARFAIFDIAPWTPREIDRFIERRSLVLDDPEAWRASIASLVQASPSIASLMSIPFFCTLLVTLVGRHGRLPSSGAATIRMILETLFSKDSGVGSGPPEIDTHDIQLLLGEIAVQMTVERRHVFRRADLFEAVRTQSPLAGADHVARLLSSVQTRSGIVVEEGVDAYRFLHASLRDYFAAIGITKDGDLVQAARQYAAKPHWHDALLMAADLVTLKQAAAAVKEMLQMNSDACVLASRLVQSLDGLRQPLATQVLSRLRELQAGHELSPAQRSLVQLEIERLTPERPA